MAVLSRFLLVAAALVLASGPALWLARTWVLPSYASQGGLFALVTLALFVWSVSSPLSGRPDTRHAIGLLGATAAIRLIAHVLAIDTLGALVLVVDVYAVARLCGTDRRTRAVSPFWLAVSFAFALPVERLIQRLIGYGLQQASASGACRVLSAAFEEVACEGVRITAEGADVLVDLPCSGARALMTVLFAYAVIAAKVRPGLPAAVLGLAYALMAAFLSNLLRVVLLASGVALGADRIGFDVMAQPWHDAVGLVSLALAAPVLLGWALAAREPARAVRAPKTPQAPRRPRPAVAGGLLLVALAGTSLPQRPLDVGPAAAPPALPARLLGAPASPLPLTDMERDYYAQYGGNAARAAYGPHALLLTETGSPLRHLHTPDDCLRGAGFEVAYLGLRFAPVPTAAWRAEAPDGRAYRVESTFVSSRGHVTASVAESVWLWLQDPSTRWSAVQRVTPWGAPDWDRAGFDAAVFAALDIRTTDATQGEDRCEDC